MTQTNPVPIQETNQEASTTTESVVDGQSVQFESRQFQNYLSDRSELITAARDYAGRYATYGESRIDIQDNLIVERDIQDHPHDNLTDKQRFLRQQVKLIASSANAITTNSTGFSPETLASVQIDSVMRNSETRAVFMDLTAVFVHEAITSNKVNIADVVADLLSIIPEFKRDPKELLNELGRRLPEGMKKTREYLSVVSNYRELSANEQLVLKPEADMGSNMSVLQPNMSEKSRRAVDSLGSIARNRLGDSDPDAIDTFKSLNTEYRLRVEAAMIDMANILESMHVQIDAQTLALFEQISTNPTALSSDIDLLIKRVAGYNKTNPIVEVVRDQSTGRLKAGLKADSYGTPTSVDGLIVDPRYPSFTAESFNFIAWVASESDPNITSFPLSHVKELVDRRYQGQGGGEKLITDICRYGASRNGQYDKFTAVALLAYIKLAAPYIHDAQSILPTTFYEKLGLSTRPQLTDAERAEAQSKRFNEFSRAAAELSGIPEGDIQSFVPPTSRLK